MPATNTELPALPPGPSTGWLRTRRIGASLLAVAATIYLGIALGRFLALAVVDCTIDKIAGIPVEWGLTGVGVGYLIASFEKVLKLANTFREYIAKPDKKISLYPDCVALAGIVAYLTLVAIAFVATRDCKAPPAIKEVVYLTRAPQHSTKPLEWVPFFFRELASGQWSPDKGTTLTESQLDALATLVQSLKACVGEDAGKDVEVAVLGFADKNEFDPPQNSVELNRQVANRRAAHLHQKISALIGQQTGQSKLVLAPLKEWSKEDPQAMASEQRYFETRPLKLTGSKRDQGLFNRRADLVISRLGVCEHLESI